MTAVDALLETISEGDLRAAVVELKELRGTGILPEGVVRRYASRLQTEVGVPGNDARNLVESAVYRMAAYRWAGI
ncbi:hypothetical protein [Burkholderia sp. Ac-20365]|uniref:hypothetical protein n=1 Tax=Burkholderia sp. Ac-20365 TaxID=2703897 RepID=UPI00197BC216|nr:hypothetical protein [Burkholderia sp. Ac-20365]MBN3761282.1 hypothetical protein [Burkholderia sp. Ac-20365]